MLNTAVSILAAIALLMPGFIIAELSVARFARSSRSADSPRLVGGVYGQRSAVGQTPQPHDIYLQTLCTVEVDENGIRNLADRVDPERGVYIAASQIARVDLVPEGPATL